MHGQRPASVEQKCLPRLEWLLLHAHECRARRGRMHPRVGDGDRHPGRCVRTRRRGRGRTSPPFRVLVTCFANDPASGGEGSDMTTGSINPYEPPKGDVTIVRPTTPDGGLQAGVAGHYDFANGEVMSEAWALTKGFKASFWGAALVLVLIQRVATWSVLALIGESHVVWRVVVGMLVSCLTAPLGLGLTMMCVRRAAGLPATFSTAFSCFDKAGPAIAASLFAALLTSLGFALLIVPGVYLAVAYAMAQPLIGDRGLGPWKALETSRKAVGKKWFQLLVLWVTVVAVTVLSVLPLGIPLIWTAPWATLVLAVTYRRIFGVATIADPVRPDGLAPPDRFVTQ